MRGLISWLAATCLLLVAACGGSSGQPASTPSGGGQAVNTCAKAKASRHLAYLVVQHLSGAAIQRCVGFESDTIDAESVMRGSGIQYQTQEAGSGPVVCQIDHEPAQLGNCLSSEEPQWSLWLETGGQWTVASTGYSRLVLHNGEGLGWRYVLPTATSPAPPPLPRQT